MNEKPNDIKQTQNSLNITFFNTTSLYLLFKSDVTSTFSTLNSFASQTEPKPSPASFDNDEDHKPSGVSIKYKYALFFFFCERLEKKIIVSNLFRFSSGCRNNSNSNETNTNDDENEECFELSNEDNCTGEFI